MKIADRMNRLLEGGFRPGTRRKWKIGYFVKQADGTWVPDERGVEKSAEQFVNYGQGWVKKSDTPPPPEPPVPETGAKPPEAADVDAASVKELPATSRVMALFSDKDAKKVGEAIKTLRDEGKEKGKLSTSKYLHKQKAETEIAPGAQAAIRIGIRKLLSDFGLTSRDHPPGERAKAKAENVVVARGKKGVVATHEASTGLIIIRADASDRAAKFFSKGGKNPTGEEVEGASSIIHEELHGCSPIAGGDYVIGNFGGTRKLIEECTTELSARKILRDGYGLSDDLTTDQNCPAYNSEIETLRLMTMSALFKNGIDTPTDRAWWEDFMGTASLKLRSSREELSIAEAYDTFIQSLPISTDQYDAAAKLQGKKTIEIREGIVSTFRETLKSQGAYGQQVRRNYISPGSVKEAKEMLEGIKKKNPDSAAKIWRRRSGGLLIASKLGHSMDELGAEPLEDWMKARGLKWESVEPQYDPTDVGPEMILALRHNDVMGAVALAFALSERGLLRYEHLSILAELQDDPGVFEAAVAELEPGPVVRA